MGLYQERIVTSVLEVQLLALTALLSTQRARGHKKSLCGELEKRALQKHNSKATNFGPSTFFSLVVGVLFNKARGLPPIVFYKRSERTSASYGVSTGL
jgi:hypothetical protein